MHKRLITKREWSKIRKNPFVFQTLLVSGLLPIPSANAPEGSRKFLDFKKKAVFTENAKRGKPPFKYRILFGKKLRTAHINVEQYLV
ncbi:hypothetical protein ACFPMF_14900 [Larkinella bovis]|uniref:Uncharacterized protein n=1 Tax=Larkinella bovis TaxID=683041 RepID=A0ABW0IAT0_9BACT